MRSRLSVLIVLTLTVGATPARSETTAYQCPDYAVRLARARNYLVRNDRAGAISALRAAQAALGECIRREAEEADQGVLLATVPALPWG